MSRIPLPDTATFSPEMQAAVDSMPAPLNLVTMMGHSPRLMPTAVEFGMTILKGLRISPRRREILILLVGARVRCTYSQTQHIPMAIGAGLDRAEVDAIIGVEPDWSAFDEVEAMIGRAGDELLRDATLSPLTVTRLREHLSDQEIVEIFFVVGHFRTLTGLCNGLDIDVDPHGEEFAPVSSVPAWSAASC